MPGNHWLAKLFLYLTLELGALLGVPMRPDEIEEITRAMTGARVERVVERDEEGDPPP